MVREDRGKTHDFCRNCNETISRVGGSNCIEAVRYWLSKFETPTRDRVDMNRSCCKLLFCGAFAALFVSMFGLTVLAQRPRIRQPVPQISNQRTDYQLTLATDAKVRVMKAPTKYDDKGNPQRYSSDELKKLKGDTTEEQRLVGYKSDLDNLHDGDLVQVTLATAKPDRSDKEKTTWVPVGQLSGMVANLSGKSFTLQVNTQIVSAVRMPNNNNGNNTKQVMDGDKMQATVIVVVTPNPNPPTPKANDKKKN